MNLQVFQQMTAPELRNYLEFFFRHYRQMDAFWFLYTTEKFGQESAEHVNELVWARVGGLAAKDLASRFQIEEKGLRGFVRALGFYPWSIIIGYRIEERDGEVILSVPSCPVQEARLKRGLKEYACRAMHEAEFVSFAKAIDPAICVECCFAPPLAHPADEYCRWQFTVPKRHGLPANKSDSLSNQQSEPD